jgi:hypothetical protein
MGFFLIHEWDSTTGGREVGLLEAENAIAALDALEAAGLPLDAEGPHHFGVSSPRGGWTTADAQREEARRWNERTRTNLPSREDLPVLGDTDLRAIADALPSKGEHPKICYENRNGIVAAYNLDAKMFVNPFGEDFAGARAAANSNARDPEPEEIRDELIRRGVREVRVYTGLVPSWVTGSVVGRENRLAKFAHVAAQSSRAAASWTVVPVERIGDGSDWSDIYGVKAAGNE